MHVCVRERPILVLAELLSPVTFGFLRVRLRLQEGDPHIAGPHAGVQVLRKRQMKALLISHTRTRAMR